MAKEMALFSWGNSGIDFCSDKKFSNLEYADGVVLLTEDLSKLQVSPDLWTIMSV